MSSTGRLTLEALNAAFRAIENESRYQPRHDCRFDGHVLRFNPWGFAACMYCGVSEAEVARPEVAR